MPAQNSGSELPRSRPTGFVHFSLRKHVKAQKKLLYSRYPLPSAANVPPLPPKVSPLAGQAIVCRDDHGAAAFKSWLAGLGDVEGGPTDAGVTDVERKQLRHGVLAFSWSSG
jgi:hypothetical protein